ncbi:DUF1848 domain-containing protein [Sneathiella marina]|uniref:DUF1848 domain-containing protein n=1 Tax=Sneathiella marina TaxID=2950108 RepID=A0ABY4W798_9PROT|nr:DUF1848 domain-containing protein [Sneathiella marina]USG61144.1 DUF1848 domain-containing protein [Sneathiella marina]
MTVISASYKTDIPAFYGDWFHQQLTQNFVETRNPFNNRKSTIPLSPEEVDAFVFWTRNAGPFLPVLYNKIVDQYPFYFQFTITGYPRLLEPSVIPSDDAVSQMVSIARNFGPHAVVWRYDPIFVSDLTPLDFHLENFKKLSRQLEGVVNEVVVSFTQPYAKTKRNLARLERKTPVNFRDPPDEIKHPFLMKLQKIAAASGIHMTLCTQPAHVTEQLPGAACIDMDRIIAMGGTNIKPGLQGNRAGCLCVASRDIGMYDSCAHGCVYCYAVNSPEKAKAALKSHKRGLAITG